MTKSYEDDGGAKVQLGSNEINNHATRCRRARDEPDSRQRTLDESRRTRNHSVCRLKPENREPDRRFAISRARHEIERGEPTKGRKHSRDRCTAGRRKEELQVSLMVSELDPNDLCASRVCRKRERRRNSRRPAQHLVQTHAPFQPLPRTPHVP